MNGRKEGKNEGQREKDTKTDDSLKNNYIWA